MGIDPYQRPMSEAPSPVSNLQKMCREQNHVGIFEQGKNMYTYIHATFFNIAEMLLIEIT